MNENGASIDKLNNLTLNEYFGEMQLDKRQKQDRRELAEKLLDIFLYAFSFVEISLANGMLADEIEQEMDNLLERDLWASLPDVTRFLIPDGMTYDEALTKYSNVKELPNVRGYINAIALSIAATTAAHLEQEYYTSYERASLLAGDTANAVFNNNDFDMAVAQGKTKKTWHTIKDEKTRPAHWAMDGVTVPINEYFIVGGEPMRYAHDMSASPQNVANCRCSVSYS